MTEQTSWPHAIGLVLTHPSLWRTALRQARRLVPVGWWRRPPFVPLPDREYLRFRLETQYGTGADGKATAAAEPEDVLTYLRWCRDQERLLGRSKWGRRHSSGTRAGWVRSRR